MKPSKVNEEKAISEVYELYKLEQKYKDVKKKYEEKRKKLSVSIRNYMYVGGFNKFQYRNGQELVDVKSVTHKKVIWDTDKLEGKLSKELCAEFIEKQYVVNNIEGLVKYLKSCGVNPKKFKSFITVNKTVNGNKLNELSELGDVKSEDVKGCYTVKESEGYVRINIKEILEESEEQ